MMYSIQADITIIIARTKKFQFNKNTPDIN